MCNNDLGSKHHHFEHPSALFPLFPSFAAEPDVIWWGICQRSARLSCPNYVLSQLFLHSQSPCWWGGVRGWKGLNAVKKMAQQNQKYLNIISTVFRANFKPSPIQATVNEINSTPGKTRTLSCTFSLLWHWFSMVTFLSISTHLLCCDILCGLQWRYLLCHGCPWAAEEQLAPLVFSMIFSSAWSTFSYYDFDVSSAVSHSIYSFWWHCLNVFSQRYHQFGWSAQLYSASHLEKSVSSTGQPWPLLMDQSVDSHYQHLVI